ncbi:MAG: CHAT domain-containing protein [Acidobacteriota bacterium]
MYVDEIEIALAPDGRVEIVRGVYGRGETETLDAAQIAPDTLRELVDAWRAMLVNRERATRDLGDPEESGVQPARGALQEIGAALMALLAPATLHAPLRENLAHARALDAPLRIRLRLPSDDTASTWHSLPWELLYDEMRHAHIATDVMTPFVRTWAHAASTARPLAEPPLRVLLAFPTPTGGPPLKIERERDLIERRLGELAVPLDWARVPDPVTLDALQQTLIAHRPHVVHIGGHGAFDDDGVGGVDFVGDDGASDRVTGARLAACLRDARQPTALIVLNVCRTSALEALDDPPFHAVAGALIAAGHNAVIAMNGPIVDGAAVAFSGALYDRLAGGDAIDQAVNTARNRLLLRNDPQPWWAVPALHLRSDDAGLIRPAAAAPSGDGAAARKIHDVSTLVAQKTRDFIGRQFVFEAVDDFLASDGGCFVLTGDPGIGKTTFLAELLRQRRYAHHFNVHESRHASTAAHALSNLCAQVIVDHHLPYAQLPNDAERGWDRLLALIEEAQQRQMRENNTRDIVLLIDALDEAAQAPSAGDNVLDLPRTLPAHVYLVMSRRNDRAVQLRFDGRHRPFELRHDAPENLADVADFVRGAAARPGIATYRRQHGMTTVAFVEQLVARSEGNFMYLHHVLLELEDGLYQLTAPEALPQGLIGYYNDHWQRLRQRSGDDWFGLALPVLAIVTMAREPLSIDFIAGTLRRADDIDVRPGQIAHALGQWRQFLHVASDKSAPSVKRYRLYHGSFHDFVHAKDEVQAERVALARARRSILDYVRSMYLRSKKRAD